MTSLLGPPSLGANTLTLRPYQQEAVEAIRGEYRRGLRSTLLVMATGLGKTVVLGTVTRLAVEKGNRVLVLAHRGELIDQAMNTLDRLGLHPAMEKASSHARAIDEPDVVVATVQTMQGGRLESWDPDYFKLVIIDECFPAGTLVDGRPIESIREGDTVESFNEGTRQGERRRVTRLFRKRPSGLVRVWLSNGTSLVCTPEHPIFIGPDQTFRYVPARGLCPGDFVYALTSPWSLADAIPSQDVRRMRDVLRPSQLDQQDDSHLFAGVQGEAERGPGQGGDTPLRRVQDAGRVSRDQRANPGEEGSGVLLGYVSGYLRGSALVGANGEDESRSCLGPDDSQESHARSRGEGQDVRDAPGDGMEATDPGWQRQGSDDSAKSTRGSSGLADGTCDPDRRDEVQPASLADELQGRHRQSGLEGGDRSRRLFALRDGTSGTGSEERRLSPIARVDRVEILEPSGDGRFGGLCPDGHVYNLEVEGNHNYFAGGMLVHNCHHAVAGTYRKVMTRFPKSRILGVTATADRGDDDDIGSVFESIAYEFSLWDAMRAPPPGPYLCRLKIVQCDVPIDLRDIRITAGDFNQADLEARITPLIETLANAVRQEIGDRKTLIFTPDVGSAQAMATALQSLGLAAEWISGKCKDRAEKVARYARGDTRVLANCALLVEGYDDPATSAIVLLCPSKSRPRIAQQVGRGTRLYPGKADCLIVDFDYLTTTHELVRAAHLLATPDDAPGVLAATQAAIVATPGLDLEEAIEQGREAFREREAIQVKARLRELRYGKRIFDPLVACDLFGLPTEVPANAVHKLAAPDQVEFLTRKGFTNAAAMSKRLAGRLIKELKARHRDGKVTYKQYAALVRGGYDPTEAREMAFEDGSAILDRILGGRKGA